MTLTRKELWIAGAFFLAVFLLYGPALRFDFVDYDDPLYITSNPWIQKGFAVEGFRLSFREWMAGNWHPLTVWSHMLDVELFGLHPAGHHLQSLFWHAANTALLFLLLSRIAGGFWPALFVAALWATHPLNVDSIAWIAERKNLLSTFFWLATLGLYTRYTRRPSPNALMLVIAGLALALMAKPMPVTLPFTLLLLDYWPLRRVEGFGRESWPAWRRLIGEKIPLFVLCGVFILTTLKTQAMSGAMEMGKPLSLGMRLAWLPVFYADYLRLFLWPAGLCALYPSPASPPAAGLVAGAVLLLGFLSGAALWKAKRRPWASIGWFWFLGTMVPVIGIVTLGLHRVADRYMYVPMIGLLVAIAWTAQDLCRGRGRRWTGILGFLWVVALGLTTRAQLPHWRNSEALFRRALEVTTDNYVMHYNLGRQLTLQKRYDPALEQFCEAIRINPDYALAHNNLGWVLRLKGEREQALPAFRESLRLMPGNMQARMNLGQTLMDLGRYAEARDELAVLLRQAPDYPGAREAYRQAAERAGAVFPMNRLSR
jgi:hypothetical protein